MALNKTSDLQEGSIQDTVQRLLLWSRRPSKTFIRIEYASEFSRLQVIQQLRNILETEKITYSEIHLSQDPNKDISEYVHDFIERLNAIPSGVVSITGFPNPLIVNFDLHHFLRAINANRENLARPQLRQFWWMSGVFTDQFIHSAPDLNSWFMVRLKLTENVSPDAEIQRYQEIQSETINIDDARRQAEDLLERYERAKTRDEPTVELATGLLIPAINMLRKAKAEKDVQDIIENQLQDLVDQESAQPDDISTIVRFLELVRSLIEIGELERSIPLAKRISEYISNHPFEGNREITERISFLAWLYRNQACYILAESMISCVKNVQEKLLEPNDPIVAITLNDLAGLYRDQGKYEQAELLYQRTLQIREMALGANHPDVATTLNDLAGLYRDQGKYEQAEPLYQRAFQIFEITLGPYNPDVATTLNNLSLLYHYQGRYEQAEPLYHRSLQILEITLGANHPDVATTLNNLAGLYYNQSKYEQALPLFQKALQIREVALGHDHPDVATTLNNLAGLYLAQVNYKQAETLYKRALRIIETALGSDHPDVAYTLNNLATLYRQQDKLEQAESLYKRALQINELDLGHNHPDVATTLNNLAGLYYEQGKYEQAEPLYQRALEICETRLGLEHPHTRVARNNYILLKNAQSK